MAEDHVHLVLRIGGRREYRAFIRSLTGYWPGSSGELKAETQRLLDQKFPVAVYETFREARAAAASPTERDEEPAARPSAAGSAE